MSRFHQSDACRGSTKLRQRLSFDATRSLQLAQWALDAKVARCLVADQLGGGGEANLLVGAVQSLSQRLEGGDVDLGVGRFGEQGAKGGVLGPTAA